MEIDGPATDVSVDASLTWAWRSDSGAEAWTPEQSTSVGSFLSEPVRPLAVVTETETEVFNTTLGKPDFSGSS